MSKTFRYYEVEQVKKDDKWGNLFVNLNAACDIDVDDEMATFDIDYENSKS